MEDKHPRLMRQETAATPQGEHLRKRYASAGKVAMVGPRFSESAVEMRNVHWHPQAGGNGRLRPMPADSRLPAPSGCHLSPAVYAAGDDPLSESNGRS
jgi:hypothetical protein